MWLCNSGDLFKAHVAASTWCLWSGEQQCWELVSSPCPSQLLPLRVGAGGAVPGWWQLLRWPHGQVPGHAAVSPVHPEPEHSRELDGGVCEHPLRPGQHLPKRGCTASLSCRLWFDLSSGITPSLWTGGECCSSRVRAGTSFAGGTLLWRVLRTAPPGSSVHPGNCLRACPRGHHRHGKPGERPTKTELETFHLFTLEHVWSLSFLQGYFQLKANPGAWILKMRKGRSDEIYRIYR